MTAGEWVGHSVNEVPMAPIAYPDAIAYLLPVYNSGTYPSGLVRGLAMMMAHQLVNKGRAAETIANLRLIASM
jgi:hypothetical protein